MLSESVVGMSLTEKFRYTWRDIVLYHLSVGAKPEDLEYVYEKELKVLPTFGVIPCAGTFGFEPYHEQPLTPVTRIEGLHAEGTLHMDHKLVLHKPIPAQGELEVEKVIREVYDRGPQKGAKINVDIIGRDAATGEPVFTNTMGTLKRLDGGWGGRDVPKTEIRIPDRAPDFTAGDSYPMNAPLLYRLTGDTFPLHVDPAFAARAGFPRPIVHGLCSLGYACRLMVGTLFPGQPERVRSIENQFRTVAMPGDCFTVQMWNTAPGETLFRMVRDSDGKAILDYGRMRWE